MKQGPMSEMELERLETLLDEAVPHGGMPLEMLDGFFSALVVSPELVMPSEYLPLVWGESQAADLAQAQARTELVMQLWNHIAWRVQQPVEDDDSAIQAVVMPLLLMPEGDGDEDDPFAGIPEDFPLGVAWASGFLHGVAMRGDAWRAWLADDEDFLDDMSMVLAMSVIDAEHAEQMEMDAGSIMTLEERMQSVVELPGMLHDLNLLRLQGGVGDQILH